MYQLFQRLQNLLPLLTQRQFFWINLYGCGLVCLSVYVNWQLQWYDYNSVVGWKYQLGSLLVGQVIFYSWMKENCRNGMGLFLLLVFIPLLLRGIVLFVYWMVWQGQLMNENVAWFPCVLPIGVLVYFISFNEWFFSFVLFVYYGNRNSILTFRHCSVERKKRRNIKTAVEVLRGQNSILKKWNNSNWTQLSEHEKRAFLQDIAKIESIALQAEFPQYSVENLQMIMQKILDKETYKLNKIFLFYGKVDWYNLTAGDMIHQLVLQTQYVLLYQQFGIEKELYGCKKTQVLIQGVQSPVALLAYDCLTGGYAKYRRDCYCLAVYNQKHQ